MWFVSGDYIDLAILGMPGETALAIQSLVFGGVLQRFPKLKVSPVHVQLMFLSNDLSQIFSFNGVNGKLRNNIFIIL